MKRYLIKPGQKVDLDSFDPDDTSLLPGGKLEAGQQLQEIEARLAEGQELLYAGHERKLLIVLQGMDTSGKDGTIRHTMRGFNPQGTRVVSFKKPSEEELDHDFLWRVHAKVPARGETVVFNRSHYEDVLVVRVHDLVPEAVCGRPATTRSSTSSACCRKTGRRSSSSFSTSVVTSSGSDCRRGWMTPRSAGSSSPATSRNASSGGTTWRRTRMRSPRPRPTARPGTWCLPTRSGIATIVVGSIVAETLEKLKLKYPKCSTSKIVVA